jgi:hypothetical protein
MTAGGSVGGVLESGGFQELLADIRRARFNLALPLKVL